MYDHNQLEIPGSFMALYMTPGRLKPTATRSVISARYEFCEDLASHLYEYARARHFDLGIAERDVLERVHQGLRVDPASVNDVEAAWVVQRLAELEGWEWTPLPTA